MSADLHHLAAAYALDALDEFERRQFEAHYPTCDVCSAEVAEFRAVATHLAASAATPAPAGLKASVMDEISRTRQLSPIVAEAPRPVSGLTRRMLFAAAAALVLLGGVLAVTLPGGDSSRSDEVVNSADAVVTSLDALTGLDGDLQVVWSDELDQVVVIGSSLEDLSADQAYALWFLLDDGVAPAGLFQAQNGTVSTVIDVDDLDVTGWGITVEPAEGSPQPTTDVIYAGTF